MRATNPYNYNLPVGPEMFFGRQGNVETFAHHLTTTPGDSFALIGGRRMGKTSLLEALLRALEPLAEDPTHGLLPLPVFLDFTGEGVDSVVAFFRTVATETQAVLTDLLSLSLPAVPTMGENEDEPLAPFFRRVLQSWGRTAMAQRGCRLRLVLLLDECEKIVEQPWAAELYGALRYLLVGRTTRSLLKVVMAGSHRFLTQVRQHGSPLRNVLKYHRLYVLDDRATHDLIARPTRAVLSEEVTQTIIEQSGGHPFLTQYIMHHLWERGLEGVTSGTIPQVAARFRHERSDFQDWSVGLGESGLQVYGVLAQAGEALTEARIRNALHPAPPDMPQALDALCYHGLVALEKDGQSYRVVGKMFQEWFAANAAGDAAGDDLLPDLRPTKPEKEVGPMRILFLAANPMDTNPLRLSEEVRTIDERLRTAQFHDKFELVQHWAVRHTDLSECLLRHTPHIVHFSGHGSPRGEIILEDVTGMTHPVSAEALSGLFRVLKDNIHCVVLNACMSVTQAQAIVQEIDCVVGMSRAIGDEAAIRFAGGFYRALGYGRSIQTAFDLGCNEIDLSGLGEEAIPKLLVKPGVDAASLTFES